MTPPPTRTLRELIADWLGIAQTCADEAATAKQINSVAWGGLKGHQVARRECADELAQTLDEMTEWLTHRRDHQYAAMQSYNDTFETANGKAHWNIHEHRAAVFQQVLDYLAQRIGE